VAWGEKGWKIEKAALGDPLGSMGANTGEQFLINPIYETEIIQAAAKKSVMMNLVRHRPMMGPSIYLPTRNRGGVQLHWLTAYGQQIQGSKPHGAERVELKVYTLAGYIPWYAERIHLINATQLQSISVKFRILFLFLVTGGIKPMRS
jgi:HK97 family phage major capsid protein